MLNLQYEPTLKMYISAKPTPPVIELRAWVNIPEQYNPILCEIWTVSGKDVTCRQISNDNFFMIDRAHVHAVHRASVATGEVITFLGEPKPC
jgi:hypothetical protein